MADGTDSTDRILRDLALSGLSPSDMDVRPLDNPEKAATQTPFTVSGYVIPYFDLHGAAVPFYRVRLFDFIPKYKQQKDTSSHIYFPKKFKETADKSQFIILTEGEKKAAIATKLGYPAVSVGGVDAWRNRVIQIPGESELSQNKGKIQGKLPPNTLVEEVSSPLATGLQELIDYLIQTDKHLIIIYDVDFKAGVGPQVQRAAASLGFELRFRGVKFNRIRQAILPTHKMPHNPDPNAKVGLDDYFTKYSKEEFEELLQTTLASRNSFPRHPNIRDFINKRLTRSNLGRKDVQAVAMGILSEIDSDGLRLRSVTEQQMYYFNLNTKKLIQASFSAAHADGMSTTPFEQHLYRQFGIGSADRQLNQWLAAQFTGEDPIDEVTPYRVFARAPNLGDKIAYQTSDSRYVTISGDANADSPDVPGLEVFDNGENGIMFESGHVQPLNLERLLEHYADQANKDSKCWWLDVLQQVRLKDRGKGRTIIALLYYVSPWLQRWRGTQLPVEMVLGEAGSGKSTLYELRLDILTGIAKLRNAPQDMKDWVASVTNTGGLHITDNVQLGDKNLRMKLSDELCRLVTESNPTIEARKYYTNAELIQMPVSCAFAITAIQQPFTAADILQRGIMIELDKGQELLAGDLSYDSGWRYQQVNRFGGREAWVAHHLLTLHRFFKLAQKKWDRHYKAKHRLVNLEQCLMLMAEVFGIEASWIPNFLSGMTDRAISESDWAFEGVHAFCQKVIEHNKWDKDLFAADIADWAKQEVDFRENEVLTNPRRLGRYIKTHKTALAQICNLVENGMVNNKIRYKVLRPRGFNPNGVPYTKGVQ